MSKLLSLLRRRGQSAADAEDIAQEAWVRFFRYAQNHTVEQPEAFLTTVALRLSIDEHRSRETRGEVVEVDETLADPAPSVEEIVSNRQQYTRLAGLMLQLDEQTRWIVLASRVHGMTYPEIARELGISVATVERRMANASEQVSEWGGGDD